MHKTHLLASFKRYNAIADPVSLLYLSIFIIVLILLPQLIIAQNITTIAGTGTEVITEMEMLHCAN